MKDAILLVFANKQDSPNCMNPNEVQEKLTLGNLKDRMWFVQPSCAVSGDGLLEGMSWVSVNGCKNK